MESVGTTTHEIYQSFRVQLGVCLELVKVMTEMDGDCVDLDFVPWQCLENLKFFSL